MVSASQNETHIPFSIETAVNIAYSCRIFKDEMDGVFMVEGTDRETVLEELRYTCESSCRLDPSLPLNFPQKRRNSRGDQTKHPE
jgi:hypothetical protein